MISSEAQAAELRARARRRLVGAVALVLAAVVVLPMVLNPEPDRVAADIPIRVPDAQTPYNPSVNSPLAQTDTSNLPAGQGTSPSSGSVISGHDTGGIPPAPPPLSSALPPSDPAQAPATAAPATPPAVTPPLSLIHI